MTLTDHVDPTSARSAVCNRSNGQITVRLTCARVAHRATQSSRGMCDSCRAIARARSGEAGFAEEKYGGFERTCETARDRETDARSPSSMVIRSRQPFATTLCRAQSRARGSMSIPVNRHCLRRNAAASSAAPAPTPTSSSVSPGSAHTAAPTSTESLVARNPFRGCRSVIWPPRSVSSVTLASSCCVGRTPRRRPAERFLHVRPARWRP